MTNSERIRKTLKYAIITIVTFVALQTVVVVMHEFTHSTVAYILGHMRSPLDIVWGNPLTFKGWDEGVGYSQLYASGQFHAAAIIGVSPLIVHAAIVISSFILMQRKWMQSRKWLFHTVFWFSIANFMEFIAYITMGSFWTSGDCYHFNHGLGLSPWIIFITGSLAIVAGLYILFREILPRMYAIISPGNRLNQWVILLMTISILFLWGSGLRVAITFYPNPQWMFGLLDATLFGLILFYCNPSRLWVVSRTEVHDMKSTCQEGR